MDDYDKYNNAVQAGGNALVFGLAGILQIAKVITFDRCEIYVCNNHIHEIKIALDDEKKKNVRGWFYVSPFDTDNIYKTDRGTPKVGIHAECPTCGATWGNEAQLKIPMYKNSFKKKYSEDNENARYAGFFYSSDIAKKKEFTFTCN